MSNADAKKPRSPLVAIMVSGLAIACIGLAAWQIYVNRDLIWPETEFDHGPRGDPSQRELGFDLSAAVIPADDILSGGPPKDGIPALTNPKFIAAADAGYLRDSDRVIGVTVGDEARAYPLRILNWHEVVNDTVGAQPLAVTYCPLCDSAAVFDRREGAAVREFGVSGLLYNSNVLMYDRGSPTESLWSQMMTQAVSGPAAKNRLKPLPVELTTWKDWRTRHPQSHVLSQDTGHDRDYKNDPYASYFDSPNLMFPVKPSSKKLGNKQPVLGVWTEGAARAYPISALAQLDTPLDDELDGHRLTLAYNKQANSVRVVHADPELHWIYSLWFAWYAFHPETEVYEP